MKRKALLILAACAVLSLAAWRLAPSTQPVADTAVTPAEAAASAPAAAAGYRVQIDFNGDITEEPAPADAAELKKALDRMVNTSSEDLVERPIPATSRGMMMDLRGRFQTTSAATIDADGHLQVPCVTSEAEIDALPDTQKKGE